MYITVYAYTYVLWFLLLQCEDFLLFFVRMFQGTEYLWVLGCGSHRTKSDDVILGFRNLWQILINIFLHLLDKTTNWIKHENNCYL